MEYLYLGILKKNPDPFKFSNLLSIIFLEYIRHIDLSFSNNLRISFLVIGSEWPSITASLYI